MAKGKKAYKRPGAKKKQGSMGFTVGMAALVLVGITAIVLSRDGGGSAAGATPVIGDHYHAVLGVNICGQWKPNTPAYESSVGVHAHDDAFMHIHPRVSEGAGDNATVGLFLKGGGRDLTAKSIKLEDGTDLTDGDECPNLGGKKGKVRWSVNGVDQEGDPSEYVPTVCQANPPSREVEDVPSETCDTIAVAFLPEGVEIGTPPAAAQNQVTDVPGGGTVPLDPGGIPATPATTAPGSATTATTAPGSATTATTASGSATTATTAPGSATTATTGG